MRSIPFSSLSSRLLGNTSLLGLDSFNRTSSLFGDLVTDRNDGFVRRVSIKVVVEVFERAVGGFGVEKVDDGQKDEIETCKDCRTIREGLGIPSRLLTDVELVSEVPDTHRRELSAYKAKELFYNVSRVLEKRIRYPPSSLKWLLLLLVFAWQVN